MTIDAGPKLVPTKLKHDAIVEALFEIRFDAKTLPEVLLGRLADHEPWKGFQQRRLPIAEVPAPIRLSDRNLRYSPMFELADPDRKRSVRIGEHVISYHQLTPYVGWSVFRPELLELVDALFTKAGSPVVRRLGLRYINALRPSVHGIEGIEDLDLRVVVGSRPITRNLNLNFTTDVHEHTSCTLRIATNDFIVGSLPEGTSTVVDVDVFTKSASRIRTAAEAKDWIENAHTREKEQFFGLLTAETIRTLSE
jgi:uncharacterized protein (TIGR04255 family)